MFGSTSTLWMVKIAAGPALGVVNHFYQIQTSVVDARTKLIAVGVEDELIQIMISRANQVRDHRVQNTIGVLSIQ